MLWSCSCCPILSYNNIQDINHLYPLSDACIRLKKKAICQFSSRYFQYFDKFHDLKVKRALSVTSDIDFYEYKINFDLVKSD